MPPTQVQELRDLTRTRKQFSRERTQHVQRLHKVLEDANIKITSVISDITGKSGRAFLDAIVAGQGIGRMNTSHAWLSTMNRTIITGSLMQRSIPSWVRQRTLLLSAA